MAHHTTNKTAHKTVHKVSNVPNRIAFLSVKSKPRNVIWYVRLSAVTAANTTLASIIKMRNKLTAVFSKIETVIIFFIKKLIQMPVLKLMQNISSGTSRKVNQLSTPTAIIKKCFNTEIMLSMRHFPIFSPFISASMPHSKHPFATESVFKSMIL